jgi:hypothetical protein
MVLVLTRAVLMRALVTSTQPLAVTTDHASSSSTALERVVAISLKMRVVTVSIPILASLNNSHIQAHSKTGAFLKE